MCVSLAPPMGGVTNDISQSFVSPCASRPRPGWPRGKLVPRSIRDPHRFKPSLFPNANPTAASFSFGLKRREGVGFHFRQANHPPAAAAGYKEYPAGRQGGYKPPAGNCWKSFPAGESSAAGQTRQNDRLPSYGQFGPRKTVGGAGGGLNPSDTFRPVGGRYTDRPDEFGTVESVWSSSSLLFPCSTAVRHRFGLLVRFAGR